ncbi:MAG: Mut7-C RNAse domain-containing protein, partial [Halanaerobium sp.]
MRGEQNNLIGGVFIKEISFRFYAILNNFIDLAKTNNLELAVEKNKLVVDDKEYKHYYRGNPSIKDRIESLGIPHTEVELILKNGVPVDFSYLVEDNDRFSVYPYFYNIKLPEGYKLQEEYPGKAKFILDVHLGKLARFLRRFNFDTSYSNNYSDCEIVETAEKENRIILTRDLGILMRKKVKWGCFIK